EETSHAAHGVRSAPPNGWVVGPEPPWTFGSGISRATVVKLPKPPHETAATEDFENMARRFIFVAMVTALAALWPASGFAATAPGTPLLASPLYASPVALSWTPSTDIANTAQSVYRYPGACTAPIPP